MSSRFLTKSLGECRYDSPISVDEHHATDEYFRSESDRILLDDYVARLPDNPRVADLPSLEVAGPREKIFFNPSGTCIGIVTCGGLCPGLNDVIRGLVMVAHYRYGVPRIYGFRYGYQGVAGEHNVIGLTPRVVGHIHEHGGTLLGSSRGPQTRPAWSTGWSSSASFSSIPSSASSMVPRNKKVLQIILSISSRHQFDRLLS